MEKTNSDGSEKTIPLALTEDSSCNKSTFKKKVFMEFLILHFLHYFCLGPFLIPFICLFRGKYLNSNLSFLSLDKAFFSQLFTFISTFSIIFVYFYYKPPYLFFIEIYMIISAGILRISIIAIKYATMSEDQLKKVYEIKLNKKEKANEFTLKEWAKQSEPIVTNELLRLLKNNTEEIPFFKFNFLGNLTKEIEEEFRVHISHFENIQKEDPCILIWNKNIFDDISSSKFKYYCGLIITKFILTKSKENGLNYKWCFWISFIFSTIRSLIPIIYREYNHHMEFKFYEVWMIIMITLLNYYYFAKNFQFIIFGIYEFDRQYRYLSQLSNLLSSKKQGKYHTKKFYPTLNLFDHFSLKSWLKIHQIFRQYGEKFKLRIEAYLSLFVLFYIVVICVMVTSFFLDTQSISELSFLVLCYEVIAIVICVLIIFQKGSAINEYYSLHIVLLRKNREILFDLMKFGEIYFDKEKFVPENPVYVKGVEIIKSTVDCRLKQYLNFAGFKIKDNSKFKMRKEILKGLIKTTDDLIDNLKTEAVLNPFSILGIEMTDNVYKSILAIFGSILLAVMKKSITQKI